MKQVLASMQVFDDENQLIYAKDFLTPNDVNAACQLYARAGYEIHVLFSAPETTDFKTSEE